MGFPTSEEIKQFETSFLEATFEDCNRITIDDVTCVATNWNRTERRTGGRRKFPVNEATHWYRVPKEEHMPGWLPENTWTGTNHDHIIVAQFEGEPIHEQRVGYMAWSVPGPKGEVELI